MRFLIDAFRSYHQKRMLESGKRTFKEALLRAVSDGELNDSEMEELSGLEHEFGLSELDMKEVRLEAYLLAFRRKKNMAGISDRDADDLKNIQTYLCLTSSDIRVTDSDFRKYRLADRLFDGEFPDIKPHNVLLKQGERAFWENQACLLEHRSTGTEYRGGHSGVSIRVAPGLYYREGRHGGHTSIVGDFVPVSTGTFVITDQRFVFVGDRKSFSVKIEDLLSVETEPGGISFSETARSATRLIRFPEAGWESVDDIILDRILAHVVGPAYEDLDTDANQGDGNVSPLVATLEKLASSLKAKDSIEKHIQEEDYQSAQLELEEYLNQYPDYPDGYRLQGIIYSGTGADHRAIECFTKAISLSPDWAENYWRLGVALLDADMVDRAIENLAKAESLEPEDAFVQLLLAVAYRRAGRMNDAEAHYKKAVQLSPGNEDKVKVIYTEMV